jgi:hypothetical protein
MVTHAPSPYPLYGHIQGFYFPAAPQHIPFPASQFPAPPMYPNTDAFSHFAPPAYPAPPPAYSFEAPQHFLPSYSPPMLSMPQCPSPMTMQAEQPPIHITFADENELKTVHQPHAETTVTVSQATNNVAPIIHHQAPAVPVVHQASIVHQQAPMAQTHQTEVTTHQVQSQEKPAAFAKDEAMAQALQNQAFLQDLKGSTVYMDNVPRPHWLEKHALAKAGLAPDEFLTVSHFEKLSSKYLALKKGGGHALIGTIPTSAAALAVTGAIIGGASIAAGPLAPAVWAGLGVAGAAPIAVMGTVGHFRSKEERAKYQEQMLQMKSALDENPEKYSAYLRTGMTPFRTEAKARNANKEGVTKLRNYLEGGAEKSVLWKAYFPVASDKIMVVTTVDSKNAARLFYKALGDVSKKAAKKAAHLA